jgi:hypothetical protein
MKTGGTNSSSTLFDLSKTFAHNAVVPKPNKKRKVQIDQVITTASFESLQI